MEKKDTMVKTVFFDMDGTIIDTEKYYRVLWPKALAHFGYHMTDEQALSMRSLGRPFAPARLKKWFGEDLDYCAVRDYRKRLMEEILDKKGIEIKSGAVEALEYLRGKGLKTAIVTATDPERTERYLTRIGLRRYFDQVICATMVKEGKPSPDIYLYACKQMGNQPSECMAVEDSPNGVLSAYRAGCKVVLVPDQTPADEEQRALIYAEVSSLEKIQELI